MTTPLLKKLEIHFIKQSTFPVPHLVRFINKTVSPRFDDAKIVFKHDENDVVMSSREAHTYIFSVTVYHWNYTEIYTVAQICNALRQVLSAVKHLTFRTFQRETSGFWGSYYSNTEKNDIYRVQWRNIIRSFGNVRTLRVEEGLVEQLSRCLGLDDRELPLELLPELQELTYSRDNSDAFTSFINARQNAGRPV